MGRNVKQTLPDPPFDDLKSREGARGVQFRAHPCRRGARGPKMLMARAASGAARGRPRALLSLALERGVLGSALESTARGHDQVHVSCILLFKCLNTNQWVTVLCTGEGIMVRQRESDFFVRKGGT